MKITNFIAKSISAKLITLFLIISIIPIIIIGIISNYSSHNALEKSAFEKLESIGTIKGDQIVSFIDRKFRDLEILSHAENTIKAFDKLHEYHDDSGANAESNFEVTTTRYKKIYNEIDPFFKKYLESYKLKDIFFICSDHGHVMYTASMEDDLGTNLAIGKYRYSGLGKLWNKVVRDKKSALIDFSYYSPSEENVAFIGSPVFDTKNKLIAVIALQLSIEKINEIMQGVTGLGETGETYIVGNDYLMKTDSRFDTELTILRQKVETESVKLGLQDKSGTHIIKDYRGVSVLSYYKDIGLNEKFGTDFEWVVIAEIDKDEAFSPANKLIKRILMIGILLMILVIFISIYFSNTISRPIKKITNIANLIASGNLNHNLKIKRKDEIGTLAASFSDLQNNTASIVNYSKLVSAGDYTAKLEPRSPKDELIIALNKMTSKVNDASIKGDLRNWLKTGQNNLNEMMRGNQNIISLSRSIITFLAKYIDAQIGALYLVEEESDVLKLTGSYAFSVRKNLNSKFNFGEGLVGQAAFEKEMIILSNIPEDYIRINSSLGDTIPTCIIVIPFIFEDNVLGVVELGSIKEFSKIELEFIKTVVKDIAIAINSSSGRTKMKVLLDKTMQQSEELQTQQEELKSSNEELEEQTEELKASTEKLKFQQEELQATNEELEEKTESLERQKTEIMEQNRLIEVAKKDIEKKAEDLAIASKYKSEFLANMSHELRTPLNSLLILSRDLADNNKGNLLEKQIESAEIIYGSGNDLLNLINEILDLSKIEAGKMTLNIQDVFLADLARSINTNFQHQTKLKGLELKVHIAEDLDEVIISDQQRIDQIIKNLLSNAIKFTEKGIITVEFKHPDPEMDLSKSGLKYQDSIAIGVTDTGIGIPADKLSAIFEAFQQADGSTSRKFGGTGLGLSISRELAKLLGGELQLKSEEGKGSTFTFIIPKIKKEAVTGDIVDRRKSQERRVGHTIPKIVERKDYKPAPSIEDDRNDITENDRKILVVEDNLNFAKTLRTFCRDKHFKFLHSGDGETGLQLAKKYVPDAIILDIKLPGIDGWCVLDNLKENPHLRHIPVHMMSAMEETIDAFQKGAIGYLMKPVKKDQLDKAFKKMESFYAKDIKDLLIVEDNETMRKAIVTLLGEDKLKITAVGLGKKAIEKIKKNKFDCIVLDLSLPDITGFEVLKELDKLKVTIPPVIIYTGKDITKEEEFELNKHTSSVIIKGVKSEERLLDETALFLHQVVDEMPKNKQKIISRIHDKDTLFEGKRVLVVDDDMRNVFAVSHILEEKGMETFSAANGKKALEILEKEKSFDMVLMDIMMPVMNGYETMENIRKQTKFKDLTIIALTAKAMKGDKEQCLAAGANDYLAKPLQIDKLLSLMRVWMYK